MAHGIYNTKTEARRALREIAKHRKDRTGVKPRLKIVTRYIIVDA